MPGPKGDTPDTEDKYIVDPYCYTNMVKPSLPITSCQISFRFPNFSQHFAIITVIGLKPQLKDYETNTLPNWSNETLPQVNFN